MSSSWFEISVPFVCRSYTNPVCRSRSATLSVWRLWLNWLLQSVEVGNLFTIFFTTRDLTSSVPCLSLTEKSHHIDLYSSTIGATINENRMVVDDFLSVHSRPRRTDFLVTAQAMASCPITFPLSAFLCCLLVLYLSGRSPSCVYLPSRYFSSNAFCPWPATGIFY